jgi:glutaredoxin
MEFSMTHTPLAKICPEARQKKPMNTLCGSAAFMALVVLLQLTTQSAHAQTVYRIVGPDGRVTFSDKAPVSTDKVTATDRSGRALDLGASVLPFELRQVASRYPVTLYTSANCAPCGSGRTLLSARGIPFAERTVNTPEDAEALSRISGENSLPFLTIGGQKIKGFSDTEWTQFLDAAGYPATSKLPSNYRSTPAAPLVAVQKPTPPAAEAATDAARPTAAQPAARVDNGSNPAGIRF